MLHDVKVHDAIQEFQPLQITEHRAVLLALLVFGIPSIVIFRGVQLRLGEALFALGGIYLPGAISACSLLCGILLVPPLSRLLAEICGANNSQSDRPG
jgi:hypothetical protein